VSDDIVIQGSDALLEC